VDIPLRSFAKIAIVIVVHPIIPFLYLTRQEPRPICGSVPKYAQIA
jgi:hypothetical protein